MSNAQSATLTRNPILWGAYLACSWTWCIGMFLPALLLRDMGWPGFLIFAIPNVLGAAAMGWFIKSRTASERFVAHHPAAVWWFSTITLVFHLFWILWISNFIRQAFQLPDRFLFGVIGIGVAFLILSGTALRRGRAPHLAAGLLCFSIGVLLVTFLTSDVKDANAVLLQAAPSSLAPLWMLPVMIFGFALCPYLDITFHHARQQLDSRNNGRLGFTIGFVAFFSLMIVLTTRYAGVVAAALEGSRVLSIASSWVAAGILTHMLCQWIFTVRVHLDRIRSVPGASSRWPVFFAAVCITGLIGVLAMKIPGYAGLSGGEIVYRSFMSAYGLIFPGYMLYRVLMARGGKQGLSLRMMWIAIVLASPMFWIGFMNRQTLWLVPGMCILLAGALFLRTKSKPSN